MTSSKLYDVLIPIELHPGLGFTGQSRRRGSSPGTIVSFNGEKALTVWGWDASLHETNSHQYLIVRTNCTETDARASIDKILGALAAVSVFIDAGVRATSKEATLGTDDVDLMQISIFPAGAMPYTFSSMSEVSVRVAVDALTAAFDLSLASRRNIDRAAEVYADIDFETSTTSRFVLTATVLELLAVRTQRDAHALVMLEGWIREAKAVDRQDLVTALGLMREQSITDAIRQLIRVASSEAGLGEKEIEHNVQRTIELYRRRGAVVHGGSAATPNEVAEFRAKARLALTGSSAKGVFSGVVEGFALDKTSRPGRDQGFR